MIDEEKLAAHHAVTMQYKKNQVIFFEGNQAFFYYQIKSGSVKMVSTGGSCKEFIQGIFTANQSFGEPMLFLDLPYPASAVANEDAEIIKISREEYLNILTEYPEILMYFTRTFALRLYHKALISTEIAVHNPEHRIFAILNLFRKNSTGVDKKNFKIRMTRQQIADMAGIRVETAIRAIKNMQKNNLIKIEKGQIILQSL